jgi:hypothetical protein
MAAHRTNAPQRQRDSREPQWGWLAEPLLNELPTKYTTLSTKSHSTQERTSPCSKDSETWVTWLACSSRPWK